MAAGDKRDAGAHNPIRELEASVGTQAAVTAATTVERDITVEGVTTTSILVGVSKPTHQAGLGIVGARIKSDGVVAITYMNATAAGITPTANEAYKFVFIQGA